MANQWRVYGAVDGTLDSIGTFDGSAAEVSRLLLVDIPETAGEDGRAAYVLLSGAWVGVTINYEGSATEGDATVTYHGVGGEDSYSDRYHVRYVLDGEGVYQRTEVTELE